MTSEHCLICLIRSTQGHQIFSKQGKTLKIAEIVSQHFWFKLTQSEDSSLFVCYKCWAKIENFHEFYKRVEKIHNHFGGPEISFSKSEALTIRHEIDSKDVSLLAIDSFDRLIDCDINYLEVEENSDKLAEDVKSIESIKEIKCGIAPNLFMDGHYEFNSDGCVGSVNSNDENAVDDPNSQKETLTTDHKTEQMVTSQFDMTCDQCTGTFTSLFEARMHYQSKHDYLYGYIKCCSKRFRRDSLVRDHILWHQNPTCFTCEECNRRFYTKRELTIHMLRHAPEGSKKFQCDKCEKKFAAKCKLSAHIRFGKCSGIDEFVCHLCNKKTKTLSGLKGHIATAHRSACNDRFVCEICAKMCKTKAHLTSHLTTHIDREETRVQCNMCGSWLKNESILKTHLRRTHNSSRLKCPRCDKTLKDQFCLNRHIMGVHSEPSHQCTFCDKSFTRALALKEHIASHTGENLYSCTYCQRKFNSSANLAKHKKRIHAIKR